METDEIVGNRVREIRRRLGMRQEDLAREVGVSRQTIISLERGSMANPTITTCLRLARVLREPVDYVFYLTRARPAESTTEKTRPIENPDLRNQPAAVVALEDETPPEKKSAQAPWSGSAPVASEEALWDF